MLPGASLRRFIAGLCPLMMGGLAFAQEEPAEDIVASMAPTVTVMPERNLLFFIENGGPVLWVIIFLGFLTFVMSLYFFMTITAGREVPKNLARRAKAQLREGDLRGAYQLCEGRVELLARVLLAGLKMHGHDRYVVQEAMESEGARGAAALWQKVSYLNNVGVIAPLLGLLGTVLGMIQAFWSIASEDSQSKGLAMAYSVSEAMITTAGGLMLAIPAMVVYFYLRGRVTKIIAAVEAEASELIELLTRENV